jgi:hypothetical protein
MYSAIKKPGDFAYRIDRVGNREKWQLAMHCPKFGICYIPIHQGEATRSPIPTWWWNGNEERPTITPSVGCDAPPRCGQHRTIQDGVIL